MPSANILHKSHKTKNTPFKQYASIIIEGGINQLLDYGIPDNLIAKLKRGSRVTVTVKGVQRIGYVYELKEQASFSPVLPICKITSEQPLLTDDLFQLAIWMSRYYCASLRQVFKAVLPSTIRKEGKAKQQQCVKRNISREELKMVVAELRHTHPQQAAILDIMLYVKKEILLTELIEKAQCGRSPVQTLCKHGYLTMQSMRLDRSPLSQADYFRTEPKQLNSEQAVALRAICHTLNQNNFCAHLLFGVTGSGKTEVYLQAIDHALKLKKNAIVLVPEISLTAQTIERFRARFDAKIAILHHRLSPGERFDEWEKIRKEQAQIVIGARSAIFCPITNLGLIIVDEEHESSYKQTEDCPCYNARDIAVMRAHHTQSTVILGSATPSIESYFNAQVGKYNLLKLNSRADNANLPNVNIIDMQIARERQQGCTTLSDELLEGIKKRFATGEQTILFLNRRGYHTTLFCPSCRTVIQCPHCDLSLTFHRNTKTLACHLCGYQRFPPPLHCPQCHRGEPMKFRGVGTEQIEAALHAIFPEIRTLRLDADTTRHKGSHEKLLRQFATGKADVLIGTQMIAKGLHFSHVTLVGVINSDGPLHIPDFRASESVFQLITQVAGRSGRGALPGEVMIQTFMPDNRTIQLAAKQDFFSFFNEEIEVRKLFHFPPYIKMVKLTVSGKERALTNSIATTIHHHLTKTLSPHYVIHPVIAAGYAKVKDYYRFQCLVRGPAIAPINQALHHLYEKLNIPAKIKVLIDVNPSSMI